MNLPAKFGAGGLIVILIITASMIALSQIGKGPLHSLEGAAAQIEQGRNLAPAPHSAVTDYFAQGGKFDQLSSTGQAHVLSVLPPPPSAGIVPTEVRVAEVREGRQGGTGQVAYTVRWSDGTFVNTARTGYRMQR